MDTNDALNEAVATALNAASAAAMNEVYEYAHQFKRREEYQPLEQELAPRVARRALTAGLAAVREWEEARA